MHLRSQKGSILMNTSRGSKSNWFFIFFFSHWDFFFLPMQVRAELGATSAPNLRKRKKTESAVRIWTTSPREITLEVHLMRVTHSEAHGCLIHAECDQTSQRTNGKRVAHPARGTLRVFMLNTALRTMSMISWRPIIHIRPRISATVFTIFVPWQFCRVKVCWSLSPADLGQKQQHTSFTLKTQKSRVLLALAVR